MRAPIFVDENGDLMAFDSVLDAARYLEPVDVKAGVYVAFDARGCRLQLAVEGVGAGHGQERVAIREFADQAPREPEFRRLLAARLAAIGVSAAALSLSEQVALAQEWFRAK